MAMALVVNNTFDMTPIRVGLQCTPGSGGLWATPGAENGTVEWHGPDIYLMKLFQAVLQRPYEFVGLEPGEYGTESTMTTLNLAKFVSLFLMLIFFQSFCQELWMLYPVIMLYVQKTQIKWTFHMKLDCGSV